MDCQSVAKTEETSPFPLEDGGSVEDTLNRGLALGLQNPPSVDHFRLKTNIIPWMASNLPLESSTLAFKSHLNAHALPTCGPNLLKPHFFLRGKLMYHCASLEPREPEMSFHISFPVIPTPPSAGRFRKEPIAILGWGAICPLESSTLAFKSHLNAHALPICSLNPLKPHLF